MPLTVERDPAQRNTLMMQGDTYDLLKVWNRHNFGGDQDGALEIFGFTVGDISEGADHGGKPALRITLEDSVATREVGRLVIQHRRDFREELPFWRVAFDSPDTAAQVYDRYANIEVGPTADFEADVVFEEGENIELQLAMWASDYRCNFTLVNPHGPGGGNPVIRVQGLTGNCREWLDQVLEVHDEAEQNELYIAS